MAEVPSDFPWEQMEEHGGKIMRAVGCRECRQVGYRGRAGIYELLVTSEAVRELAHERRSSWDVRKSAVADGMITLRQDGWRKVLSGATSIDEVVRVTKSDRV